MYVFMYVINFKRIGVSTWIFCQIKPKKRLWALKFRFLGQNFLSFRIEIGHLSDFFHFHWHISTVSTDLFYFFLYDLTSRLQYFFNGEEFTKSSWKMVKLDLVSRTLVFYTWLPLKDQNYGKEAFPRYYVHRLFGSAWTSEHATWILTRNRETPCI